jgi:hypothetical protein
MVVISVIGAAIVVTGVVQTVRLVMTDGYGQNPTREHSPLI